MYPQRRQKMDSAFFLLPVLSTLMLFLLYATPSLNAPYLDTSPYCILSDISYANFLNTWDIYVITSLFYLVPGAFLFCVNIPVVVQLCRRRSLLSVDQQNYQEIDNEAGESKLALMQLIMSVIFLVLSLPNVVFYLSGFRDDVAADGYNVAKYRKMVFQVVSHALADFAQAISIPLFFLMSSRFRFQLKKLLAKEGVEMELI